MRAARLHDYTEEMDDALAIEDVDRSEATEPNHVVVEIEGAGWCRTDNHAIEGMWEEQMGQTLPMTLGHENAGIVAETGDDVTLVSEGDAVVCHPAMTCGICRACRQGRDMHCENLAFPGLSTDGGFAEYLLTNERAVIPLPDGVDPAEIAPHADAGITAYHAVKKAARELNPGEPAVVVGVGGLGHIGLQALRAMSAAEITAVDVKDEALTLATDLGAHHTINARTEDVADEMDALTDGTGVKQIIDFVGTDGTLDYAPNLLAGGGDHHVVGYGGHIHEPAQSLVNGDFDYRGTLVGTYPELQELMALVARGDVSLRTSRYGLDEINEVAAKLERGEIEGRAVIVP